MVELIWHYQHHPLVEYNATLDLMLTHPVSRFQPVQVKENNVDVTGRKLKEVHCRYQEKSKEFDRLYEAFTKSSQVNISAQTVSDIHANATVTFIRLSYCMCSMCHAGNPDEANSN